MKTNDNTWYTRQTHLENQEGFILVVGMAILVVLTLLGLSATRNTVIDLKISGNERQIAQNFYIAESTWQVGGLWLNHEPRAPEIVNITPKGTDTEVDITKEFYAIVRNYGEGGDGVTNESFGAGTQDGNFLATDFWYRVLYHGDRAADEFGEDYRDFNMGVHNNVDKKAGIATRFFKVYKVGY